MGTKRDQPRVLSSGRARQLRDALVLLGSLVLVLAAAGARRGPPAGQAGSSRSGSDPAGDPAGAPPLPSPLPSGAEPERLSIPEQDVEAGCGFADRGFGAYERWRPLPLGKVLIPPVHGAAAPLGPDGGYDLLLHFHGAEAVRKELAPLDLGFVIAAVDAGTRSSHYERALGDGAWSELLRSIDREVADAAGLPAAHARHIAVSSWSAGSGAVSRVLAQGGATRIDALLLLDSLYAGYAPGRTALIPGQLAPYVEEARAAARGGPLFYLTHTAIPTTGYASTAEAATFLLGELGAAAVPVAPPEGDPAPLTRMYDGGSLYVRGYAGATADDHCAQLRLLPAILAEHVLPLFER